MLAAIGLPEEVFLDLSPYGDYPAMKRGMEQQLAMLSYQVGTGVFIQVGQQRLTNQHVRELEDALLDYGLFLKDIIYDHKNYIPAGEKPLIEDMPHYRETLLLYRHIRSGQKMSYHGNIVVLGDVNPGAEVIAGGNILVLGALRGMAHAGAMGDEAAIVTAYRLSPTQLRIANHITRPPDGETVIVKEPELARIRAGKVIIEKLKI